ncbi:uncharacterized protein LOC100883445 isoform X4 [Megachile rotundata]|uniref:uncharacterized protein LOC100883445 isoform X4 n=1 Tax=Megachile rotundata TaxID=143995 RepID=UPI00061515C3|nr:PREDICTED: uncharacterized protein LOC100883558 [Megachile rotundata]
MTEAWTKTNGFKERKKWRPFHATDFDSLMYPCFLMCDILGIFPYKCGPSGYSISRTRFIRCMITATLFLSMLISIEYLLIVGIATVNTIPKIIHQHFYFFMMTTIILITHFQTRAKLYLLQAMLNISSMLTPKDFNDLAKFIHAKDIGIFLFVISHLPNCFTADTHMTIRNLASFSTALSTVSMEMFYINCACVLKACFSKVNEDIYQLKKPTSQKFLRNGQNTPSLLTKLKSFEEKHLLISNVVQLLNKTFFLRITIATCITFVSVTFNMYFFILRMNGGENGVSYLSFWYLPYISSAVFHFCKYALLIWACESATSQAVKIRVTLYDVLGEVSDMTMKRETAAPVNYLPLHARALRFLRHNCSLLQLMLCIK